MNYLEWLRVKYNLIQVSAEIHNSCYSWAYKPSEYETPPSAGCHLTRAFHPKNMK